MKPSQTARGGVSTEAMGGKPLGRRLNFAVKSTRSGNSLRELLISLYNHYILSYTDQVVHYIFSNPFTYV